MALLPAQAFFAKWVPLLADNAFQDIDGARFERLLADLRDSAVFLDSAPASVPVPLFDAAEVFAVGSLVRHTAAGQAEKFYGSLQAGLLPTPTGATNASWQLVAKPVAVLVTAAQLTAVATTLPLRPTRTASDSLTAADIGAVVPVSTAGAATLTVAAGLGLAAPPGTDVGAARVCYPLQTGAGQFTLTAAAGVTLLPAPGGGLKSPGQGGRLVLIWLDTNTVLVEGGVA